MARNTVWQDDFWLPIMQLYLKRPVGVKATYSRDMVHLSMELHVAPPVLVQRMQQIATLSTPRIERIWETYAKNPRRLKRAVALWRSMRGFGDADLFYSGVEVTESFERDFRPLDEDERLTPVALILVLDLYFRLTPATMVAETPEVQELARLMGVPTPLVVTLLRLYQLCDPYLNRSEVSSSPLFLRCQEMWSRYGNGDTEQLAAYAAELKEYYNS